jgi:hypothetical protein
VDVGQVVALDDDAEDGEESSPEQHEGQLAAGPVGVAATQHRGGHGGGRDDAPDPEPEHQRGQEAHPDEGAEAVLPTSPGGGDAGFLA